MMDNKSLSLKVQQRAPFSIFSCFLNAALSSIQNITHHHTFPSQNDTWRNVEPLCKIGSDEYNLKTSHSQTNMTCRTHTAFFLNDILNKYVIVNSEYHSKNRKWLCDPVQTFLLLCLKVPDQECKSPRVVTMTDHKYPHLLAVVFGPDSQCHCPIQYFLFQFKAMLQESTGFKSVVHWS